MPTGTSAISRSRTESPAATDRARRRALVGLDRRTVSVRQLPVRTRFGQRRSAGRRRSACPCGSLCTPASMQHVAWHVAEGEIVIERIRIEPARAIGIRHQRLQLGREGDRRSVPAVEQRLLAGAIAREQQAVDAARRTARRQTCRSAATSIDVPLRDMPRACTSVSLAVRKRDTLAFELSAQLEVVVDLAVEDDPAVAGRVLHRLIAGRRQIDDRETAVRETDPPVFGTPQPAASGPRWVMVSRMAVSRSRSTTGACETMPAMPHTTVRCLPAFAAR